MSGLTFTQVSKIQHLVESEQIGFSHLADDLIDHICCMIEKEMEAGMRFDEAFDKVTLQIGGANTLKKIEEKTLLLIDQKYRKMKTTMKVFSLISLITIAFGATFKLMHWPGAGILLLLGFATLGFVFYPAAIFVMKREHKIKWGNFIYAVALIGGIALIFGVLFKLQHYPGASYLLLTGFVSFIFLLIPAILISKISTAADKKIRYIHLLGGLFLMIVLIGECSKFFHWPGAAAELLFGSIALSLVWLPLYTYHSFKNSQFVKGGFIYLCTGIIFFSLFNMLLSLNVSKAVMDDYVQPAITYNTGIDAFEKYNEALIATLSSDSATDSAVIQKIASVHNSATELCQYIAEVKTNLILNTDKISQSEAAAISKDHYQMIGKSDWDVTTNMLCGNSPTGNDGSGHAIQVKLESYRDSLLAIVSDNTAVTALISNILSTKIPPQLEPEYNSSWVMYNFYHVPAMGALNTMTRLIFNVRIAENSVIKHIIFQSSREL